jgi:hypothetical protein
MLIAANMRPEHQPATTEPRKTTATGRSATFAKYSG